MKIITAQDAYSALTKNEAIMIDVREQDEYDQARIGSVFFAPLSTLPKSIQTIDFKEHSSKKIIFQCLKGGRSAQAIEYLQDSILKGYDVYNLEGGILAWAEADLPLIYGSNE